ncbi:MAG TPA: glycosyltransferase family 2 protein [Pyrinomonadaceae bacterium]|jgi:cellulose synthase/poly-beta-1,6-N-acetylglucosamine synthase-like glycosyltransferase|nr:glycosyltransferase family 2 protein [Pyrinomonadaceae bacterium]
MVVFYFLAALSCWFGIQSLLNGIRYAAYVRRETSRAFPEFQPFVSVIAPGRGLEHGLSDNLSPLLTQNYPRYEVLFVFDAPDDPAIGVVDELGRGFSRMARTIIAGSATDTGQKVHNLRVAVTEVDRNAEVLVFVDTDARPGTHWLKQLVAPLADETLGASTGYRWFIPERGGVASRLRGVWNASVASALGGDTAKNFCWGGSTAIRRSTFEKLNVSDRWRGTVSDDFTITSVLKEANLPIHFTPHCLVASVGDCDFKELFEFTTRQIKITRVYASHLWLPLLLGSAHFVLVFFGGLILLILQILQILSSSFILPLALLVIFTLGAAKSFIRWRAINIPLNHYRSSLKRDLLAHIFLWPLASLLYLYNAIVAGLSRRITWRGITYELKSPSEAVIISRES